MHPPPCREPWWCTSYESFVQIYAFLTLSTKDWFVKAPIQDPQCCKKNIKAAKTYAKAIRGENIWVWRTTRSRADQGLELIYAPFILWTYVHFLWLDCFDRARFLNSSNEIPRLSILTSCWDFFLLTHKSTLLGCKDFLSLSIHNLNPLGTE